VRIRLLGGFVVERGGQPVNARAWRLRKARTLVKLLALARDQRLHRDLLLETLWPDRDRMSAVNNLHQALHVARRVLAGDGPTDGLLELRDDVVVLLADGHAVRNAGRLTTVPEWPADHPRSVLVMIARLNVGAAHE
jgi:DNA-binding SARP family transcriptional activator